MFELFKILGTVAIDNSDANQSLSETESKASETSKSIGERMQSGLGKAEKAVGKVGKGMSKWVSGPIAAVGTGAFAMANKVTGSFDDIAKGSQRMGITTDYYQEMDYWAQQNGLSSGNMEKAIERLNQRIGLADQGNEKYTEGFKNLGVELKDTEGNMRSTEDVMTDTIMALSQIEDEQTQSAVASELFGTKLSRQLMPALQDGATSIEEAKEMAAEFGYVIGEDNIQAGVEFQNTMTDLQVEFSGLFRELMTNLIPLFSDVLFPLLQDTIIPAIGSFVDKIGELAEWFNGLSPTVQENILIFAGLLAALGPILVVVSKVIGGIKLLVGVFSFLFSPVGAVIAIVAALIGIGVLLYQNWDVIKEKASQLGEWLATVWESIKEWTMETWNSIKESISQSWEDIKTRTIETWNSIKENLLLTWENIKTWALETWNSLKETISQAWQSIKTRTIETWNSLKENLSQTWESIKTWAIETWNSLKETISNAWQSVKDTTLNIWNGIKDFISSTWENIKFAVTSAITGVKNTITNVWNSVKTATSNVWSAISSTISNIWNQIKNAVTNSINAVKNTITNVWNSVKAATANVWNAISSTISSVWSSISSTVSSAINGVRNIVSNVWSAITSFTSNTWNNILSTISNIVNNIRSTVSNIFNSLRSIVSNAFSNVVSAVSEGMTNAWNKVKEFAGKFKDAGKNIVTSIADGIKGAVGKVTDAIGGVVEKVRDFLPFSPAKVGPLTDIHKLNFGGPITHSIEADENKVQQALKHLLEVPDVNREVELPISSNELTKGNGTSTQRVQETSQVKKMLSSLLDKIDDLGNRPIEIEVTLDGRVLARVTRDPMDRELGKKNRDKNQAKGRK